MAKVFIGHCFRKFGGTDIFTVIRVIEGIATCRINRNGEKNIPVELIEKMVADGIWEEVFDL